MASLHALVSNVHGVSVSLEIRPRRPLETSAVNRVGCLRSDIGQIFRSSGSSHNEFPNRPTSLHSVQSCSRSDSHEVQISSVLLVERRKILQCISIAAGLAVGASLVQPLTSLAEESKEGEVTSQVREQVEFAPVDDTLNAVTYNYALALPPGLPAVSWVETRRPERYSSAAPLAPDARLRIVSERLDFKNSLVMSVMVGPPNGAFLPLQDPQAWDAMNVARSVLADKSSARMTSEQRVREIVVGDTHTDEVDGQRYWYFEYLSQKSPTIYGSEPDVYRHNVAVSASREGYLYTLNISSLDKSWTKLAPVLQQSIESFRLLPTSSDYVPPWKDPWRFW